MKVLVAPGCGDPTALIGEIMTQAERLAPITLMGGLRLDRYPFAAAALRREGALRHLALVAALHAPRHAATSISFRRDTSTR